MKPDQVNQSIEDVLTAALKETGASLETSAAAVAEYATERAAHLASIAGQPGFDRALLAERDNVGLFAGLEAAKTAGVVDQQLLGTILGALGVAARALAAS